jgi:hypothetical protein
MSVWVSECNVSCIPCVFLLVLDLYLAVYTFLNFLLCSQPQRNLVKVLVAQMYIFQSNIVNTLYSQPDKLFMLVCHDYAIIFVYSHTYLHLMHPPCRNGLTCRINVYVARKLEVRIWNVQCFANTEGHMGRSVLARQRVIVYVLFYYIIY